MKKGFALLLAIGLFCAGCVVQSIKPWLSDATRVGEPSLLGSWHDAKNDVVAFFTEASDAKSDYQVLLIGNGKDVLRYAATLHRIDNVLLLEAAPDDAVNLESCVLLPCHLLFKVVLDGMSLKLHAIDVESFGERAATAQVPLLPGGSKNDGYVLTGATPDSEAFLRAQLADPEFFDEMPLYSFQKLPVAAP